MKWPFLSIGIKPSAWYVRMKPLSSMPVAIHRHVMMFMMISREAEVRIIRKKL